MSRAQLRTLVFAASALFLACGSGSSADEELCGNGVLDPGESCDDGNRTDGDNCPANCKGAAVVFAVSANGCPVLQQLSVLPSAAPVGSDIALAALASDPEGHRVYYDFTSSGTLTHVTNSKRATFHCITPGPYVITVWLSDHEGCTTSSEFTVLCV